VWNFLSRISLFPSLILLLDQSIPNCVNKKENRPKPKKHQSKDKSNSGNYLPATIAKLEAYSKQNKKGLSEEDEFSQK
jgi:hypothetical protein